MKTLKLLLLPWIFLFLFDSRRYAAYQSSWKHRLPCSDVTQKVERLFLLVYEWPKDGKLYVTHKKPNNLISAIGLKLGGEPIVDPVLSVDPNTSLVLSTHFASLKNWSKHKKS